MLSEGCYGVNLQCPYQIHGASSYSQAQSVIFSIAVDAVLFLR